MDGIEQESRADLIKVGVIQYIRALRAKLDVHAFSNFRIFEERCVPAPRSGTKYRTTRSVAWSNAAGGRITKQGCIKPMRDGVRGMLICVRKLIRAGVKKRSAIEFSQAEPRRIKMHAVDSEP